MTAIVPNNDAQAAGQVNTQTQNSQQANKNTQLPQESSKHQIKAIKILTVYDKDMCKDIYERLQFIKQSTQGNKFCIDFEVKAYKDTQKQQETFYIDIIMPFANNGSLDKKIQSRILKRQYWTNSQLNEFYQQLLETFEHLINIKKLIHGDIKPHNILYIDDQMKISDFRFNPEGDSISILPGIPSEHFEYLAPVLRENKQTVQHDPNRSDVFSFGLMFLQMVGLIQIKGLNTESDIQKSLEEIQNRSHNYESEIFLKLKQMLVFDQNKRPDFGQLKFKSQATPSKNMVQSKTIYQYLNKQIVDSYLQGKQVTQSLLLFDSEKVYRSLLYYPVVNHNKNQKLVKANLGDSDPEDEEENIEQKINPLVQDIVQQQRAITNGGFSFVSQPIFLIEKELAIEQGGLLSGTF